MYTHSRCLLTSTGSGSRKEYESEEFYAKRCLLALVLVLLISVEAKMLFSGHEEVISKALEETKPVEIQLESRTFDIKAITSQLKQSNKKIKELQEAALNSTATKQLEIDMVTAQMQKEKEIKLNLQFELQSLLNQTEQKVLQLRRVIDTLPCGRTSGCYTGEFSSINVDSFTSCCTECRLKSSCIHMSYRNANDRCRLFDNVTGVNDNRFWERDLDGDVTNVTTCNLVNDTEDSENFNFLITGRQCPLHKHNSEFPRKYSPPQYFHSTAAKQWPARKEDATGAVISMNSFQVPQDDWMFDNAHRFLYSLTNTTLILAMDDVKKSRQPIVEDIISLYNLTRVDAPEYGFTTVHVGPFQLFSKETPDTTNKSYVFLGAVTIDVPLEMQDKNFTRSDMRDERLRSKNIAVMRTSSQTWIAHQTFYYDVYSYFDFLFPVDNDVAIFKPFPNLAYEMWENNAWLLHTKLVETRQKSGNLDALMEDFLVGESYACGHTVKARGGNDTYFKDMTNTVWSNFIGFWRGLFHSDEIKYFAYRFANFPHGRFENNWGDQVYWMRVMSLMVKNQTDKIIDRSTWRDELMFIHKPEKTAKELGFKSVKEYAKRIADGNETVARGRLW